MLDSYLREGVKLDAHNHMVSRSTGLWDQRCQVMKL